MDHNSPLYLIVSMSEPLSDEVAAAMANFLFDLATHFENDFAAQIRRHYDHRESTLHEQRDLFPGKKKEHSKADVDDDK